MKSYVGDLSEQNEVLVQTIEELETEANERYVVLDVLTFGYDFLSVKEKQ